MCLERGYDQTNRLGQPFPGRVIAAVDIHPTGHDVLGDIVILVSVLGGAFLKEVADLEVKVIHYPFMGTGINTERLLLMTRLCYAPLGSEDIMRMVHGKDGPSDKEAGKFVRGLVKSGHLGALEHWVTSFAVEGYSRISSQQNDRHRLMKMFKEPGVYMTEPEQSSPDVSQLQQSQRYVKEKEFRYVVPPSFRRHPEFLQRFHALQAEIRKLQVEGLREGIGAEDVRFALSNATETRFIITTNARQLRHMFNLRCCTRSQWEIRALFQRLLAIYRQIAPNIFFGAGASCDERGYCPESQWSCGRAPTLKELQSAYKQRGSDDESI